MKNWFPDEDIDTDAYYSLNDTAQEIMDSPEGLDLRALNGELMKIAK